MSLTIATAAPSDDPSMVVVGAGPAGVRAAQTLMRHGVRPVIVDEAALPGGQIYRQNAVPRATAQQRYGFEWRRAHAIHAAGEQLQRDADYRARTTVWGASPGLLDVMRDGEIDTIAYSRLLLATGATDRVMPFEGWTLPGVFTLGGAQIALKSQGCLLGPRIIFAGTGPLLYLVAYQYAKAGAQVIAVLDSAKLSRYAGALPQLVTSQPTTLAKGLYYQGWLRAHGVPVHHAVPLQAALGTDRVEGVRLHLGGSDLTLPCDTLAVGHGLRPETQLADLLDCEFAFDATQRAWLPRLDSEGRSSVPEVYLAGDGAGIGGAVHAELAGERAALAMLADSGIAVDGRQARRLAQRQAAWARFRQALDRVGEPPRASNCGDNVIVCRCEEVRAATLREAAASYCLDDLNRLKALTRVGMGLCQGRMCQHGAAELLAHYRGVPLASIGRLRGQAPVKPLPLADLSKL